MNKTVSKAEFFKTVADKVIELKIKSASIKLFQAGNAGQLCTSSPPLPAYMLSSPFTQVSMAGMMRPLLPPARRPYPPNPSGMAHQPPYLTRQQPQEEGRVVIRVERCAGSDDVFWAIHYLLMRSGITTTVTSTPLDNREGDIVVTITDVGRTPLPYDVGVSVTEVVSRSPVLRFTGTIGETVGEIQELVEDKPTASTQAEFDKLVALADVPGVSCVVTVKTQTSVKMSSRVSSQNLEIISEEAWVNLSKAVEDLTTAGKSCGDEVHVCLSAVVSGDSAANRAFINF